MKQSPHNWVGFHPLYNLNNQFFFHCSNDIRSAFQATCQDEQLAGRIPSNPNLPLLPKLSNDPLAQEIQMTFSARNIFPNKKGFDERE